MKAREVKRAYLVARYAEKRAALKEIVNKSNDPVEAYEAARKLQSIPKNANPIRLHNRCKLTGRPKGYIRQFGISRIQLKGFTKVLILRMRGVPAVDASAVNALEALLKKCNGSGVSLILSHVNEQPMKTLEKDDFISRIGRENVCEHIDAALERANEILKNM